MIAVNKDDQDFLKLLFCYDYIKLLKRMLAETEEKIATITEAKDLCEAENRKMLKADKVYKNEIRRSAYVRNILALNANLREKNKQLRRTNNDLVADVISLRTQLDLLKTPKQ